MQVEDPVKSGGAEERALARVCREGNDADDVLLVDQVWAQNLFDDG
jgi:hypothetical protein